MKRLLVALAALALNSPASAEQPTPLAPAAPAETPSASTVAPSAAAEGVARAFLVNSGVVDSAFDVALSERFAGARAQFQRHDQFRSMTRARREAALAVFDTMPDVMREEVTRLLPNAVRAFAADVDRTFSPAHLVEIDAYVNSSAGRKLIAEGISAGLRGGQAGAQGADTARAALATMTDAEAAATMRFVTSDAGMAFATGMEGLVGQLQSTLMASLTPALPVVMARVQADLCAAMGNDCPREFRP